MVTLVRSLVDWRSISTTSGGQSVTMDSDKLKQRRLADNLGFWAIFILATLGGFGELYNTMSIFSIVVSGGSRGGSLGSIEPPFEIEVSGRLKQQDTLYNTARLMGLRVSIACVWTCVSRTPSIIQPG